MILTNALNGKISLRLSLYSASWCMLKFFY
ncbi:MAG: hypothetical protein ACJAXH_000792 [Colwellia sp.]